MSSMEVAEHQSQHNAEQKVVCYSKRLLVAVQEVTLKSSLESSLKLH